MMDLDKAIELLRLGPGINEDVSEEYNEAVEVAINALKTLKLYKSTFFSNYKPQTMKIKDEHNKN